MTDATPTQPTGSGKWIWRKPLVRDVIEFGTLPDPRDARIAELEAALREIHKITGSYTGHGESARVFAAWRIADAAIMQAPERDMTITHEAMDA